MYDKVLTHKPQGNDWFKITTHTAKTTASSWPPTCILYILCSGPVWKEVTSQESLFVLQRTLWKKQTKQNGLPFSHHCESDWSHFMLGIQTVSMSDRKLQQIPLRFGFSFACGRRDRKGGGNKFCCLHQHAQSAEWLSIREARANSARHTAKSPIDGHPKMLLLLTCFVKGSLKMLYQIGTSLNFGP